MVKEAGMSVAGVDWLSWSVGPGPELHKWYLLYGFEHDRRGCLLRLQLGPGSTVAAGGHSDDGQYDRYAELRRIC